MDFPTDPTLPTLASAPRRARCATCDLPQATCICGLVAPVDNAVDVLLLQHPREAREAKGSARLLRLGLARCRLVVGESFDDDVLAALLAADGARSVLLYPADGPGVADAAPAIVRDPSTSSRLVVIDATWRKAAGIVQAHPRLRALPRLALEPAQGGRYAALRKARAPHQLSTLEAACAALAQLEGDAARYAPLLRAFARFVDDRVARTPRRAPSST